LAAVSGLSAGTAWAKAEHPSTRKARGMERNVLIRVIDTPIPLVENSALNFLQGEHAYDTRILVRGYFDAATQAWK
jgi:hypothetical protein